MHWLYQHLLKPILFRQDPEEIHDRFVRLGQFLGSSSLTRGLISFLFRYKHPVLEQEILGIRFPNPIGLAGGFDKNAKLTSITPCVGFGFQEIGSITGEPCTGNPRPRLWRLPESKALLVYYGLPNDGAEAISKKLAGKHFAIPIGVNVAKTNSPAAADTQAAITDYVKGVRAFLEIGNYFTINISCPNAFGGEPFSDPNRLNLLLDEIDQIETIDLSRDNFSLRNAQISSENREARRRSIWNILRGALSDLQPKSGRCSRKGCPAKGLKKPIFLKLSADTSLEELEALVKVADQHRVHGFIISNLTKRRDLSSINQEEIQGQEKGSISGKPVAELANKLISHLYKLAGDKYVIIGCGGVFSAEDAYQKIKLGASLVQMLTGMVFEGPQVIGQINKGLVKLLKRDGHKNISQAVGTSKSHPLGG